MIRRNQVAPRDLVVAFRLDGGIRHPPHTLYDAAEELLSLWEQQLPHSPLTWVGAAREVPATADQRWDSLVTEIKARIRRRGDRTATAGHADAAHLLLTDEELLRELRWARRNRWRTGIEDLFGVACEVLLPSAPCSWWRLTSAARAAGFRWLGVSGTGHPEAAPSPVSTFHSYSSTELLVEAGRAKRRPAAEALAAAIATRAGEAAGGRTMLLLEPGDAATLPAVAAALVMLLEGGGRLLTLADVRPDPDEPPGPPVRPDDGGDLAPVVGPAGPAAVGCSPASLARWQAAAALRPARRVDRCDRLLRLLAAPARQPDAPAADAAHLGPETAGQRPTPPS